MTKREQVRVRVVASTQMRLDQWQASPELVKAARKLLDSREFQAMLAVLRNENPSNYGLRPPASDSDHVAHAYKSTGYALALNNLEALGVLERRRGALEATFEPEEPPKTTELKDDPYAHRHD